MEPTKDIMAPGTSNSKKTFPSLELKRKRRKGYCGNPVSVRAGGTRHPYTYAYIHTCVCMNMKFRGVRLEV